MGKGRYLLKRFIYIVFVFFIISILMFFIYKIMPGDPVTMMLGDAKANMKPDAYQRLYDQTRENLGLNGPLIVQYIRWIGNMLTGNFGYSTQYKKDVIDMIGTPMLNTVMLNLVSMLVTFLIAVPLGIATAVRKNGVFDKTIQVVTIIGYSLPSFIIALLAIFAFAVKIPIFPISGVRTAGFEGNALQTALDTLWHMSLPVIVMSISGIGSITRYVRAAMIDVLRMDYIKTARAKGLREKVVIYVHAFRNAQTARALRTEQAFVPGEAQHVHAQCAHVHRHGARRLRRIQHEQGTCLVRHACHARDVVHVARQIRRVRGSDELWTARERALVRREIKRGIRQNVGDLHPATALVTCAKERAQYGVVRSRCGHGALPRRKQAVNGRVERHRDVQCERNARSRRGPKQLRHASARVVYRHARSQRRRVHAAPHAAERRQGVRDSLRHLGRLLQCSGRIVEINHGSSFYQAPPDLPERRESRRKASSHASPLALSYRSSAQSAAPMAPA